MPTQDNFLIPRSVLFGNPEKISARLNPNGTILSYIAPSDGVLNIYTCSPDNPLEAEAVTFDKERGIRGYSWTYAPNRLIYSQDKNGDENAQLFLVNTITKNVMAISPEGSVSHLAGASRDFPTTIIISNNARTEQYFDLYSVDLLSGESTLFFQNDDNFADFVLDDQLQVRFAVKMNADGSTEYFQYINGIFSHFLLIPFEDSETTSILGLNRAGTHLYLVDSRDVDKAALWSIELDSHRAQLLGSSDLADISQIIANPETGAIQAYFVEYLRREPVFLDPAFQAQWNIASKITAGEMYITSRSEDDRLWIVAFSAENSDISYYTYDTLLQKSTFLFSSKPSLQDYKLNFMEPLIIEARDGLNLVSYLTLPNQETLANKGNKSYPLVLIVHGGPVCRDSWGYSAEHQWLSNRGFAVLAVNYRSSSGFGKNFIRAGDGEWGGKMHTDLLDAVSWAVQNGICSEDNVAIYGGSYGGYATLVGLTMTPKTFKCGIDIVGPSNLKTLYDTVPPYWAPFKSVLRRRFGLAAQESPEDIQILAKQSPITFAQNIERPILIAQGANDPRVKQNEADQIVQILQEKNIPYTYLLFPTEGHGFARPENRKAFYALTEEFLSQIFHSPLETITDEVERAQIIINPDIPAVI